MREHEIRDLVDLLVTEAELVQGCLALLRGDFFGMIDNAGNLCTIFAEIESGQKCGKNFAVANAD